MSIGFGAGEDLQQAERTGKKESAEGINQPKKLQEKCRTQNAQVGTAGRKLLWQITKKNIFQITG